MELVQNRTGKPRFVTNDGVKYALVPVTMIVPGVLPGSKGPLLYRDKVVARNVAAWENKPITLNHPDHMGSPVSAGFPGIWDRTGLGVVQKPAVRNGRLCGIGKFDLERTKRVSKDVYNAIMRGEPMELSTGLYTKNVERAGTFDGRSYTHEVVDMTPDHLAILPHQKGACSLNDGCGLMVENEGKPALNESAVDGFWSWLRGFVTNQGRHPATGKYQGTAKRAAEKGFDAAEDPSTEGEAILDEDETTENKSKKCPECGGDMVDGECEDCGYDEDEDETNNELSDAARQANGKAGKLSAGTSHEMSKGASELAVEAAEAHRAAGFGHLKAESSIRKVDFAHNQSHEETRGKLSAALRSEVSQDQPSPYIREVHDDHMVYDHGPDTFKRGYTASEDGSVKLDKKPQKVRMETSFVPVDNTDEEVTPMSFNRAEAVKKLTTNCSCWKGADKALNAMTDDQLKAVVNAAEPDADDEEDADKKKKGPPEMPVKNAYEQFMETAPREVKELIANGLVGAKKVVVDKLVANVDAKKRAETAKGLMEKDLATLNAMLEAQALVGPVQNRMQPAYVGLGGYGPEFNTPEAEAGETATENAEDDLLDLPTLNLAELSKSQRHAAASN